VVATKDFPDHHHFEPGQISQLCREASSFDAIPITTEKDYVRLSDDAKALVQVLRVDLQWADQESLGQILKNLCDAD